MIQNIRQSNQRILTVPPGSVRLFVVSLLTLILVCAMPFSTTQGSDWLLSDFNGTGFDYTFGGFSQTLSPTSVQLSNLANDSGGGGISQTLDLSGHADSRFVVDLFTHPGNGINQFDLELIDTTGTTGKWRLGVSALEAGVPGTLVSATTLGNPTHGIGDFANLDLNNIATWQILGTFNTPSPFDLSFDRVLISDTVQAPDPYVGHGANAPWRAVAASRIDANRKANIQVNVTDSLGNALPGASVSAQMIKHEFGFGSVLQANRLKDNNPIHDTYKQKVTELFNLVGIENNLKWPPWDGDWGSSFSQQGAHNAVNWLTNQNIRVRGHNMVWPGYNNLPNSVKSLLDNGPLNAAEQQQLRDAIANHIADIGGAFAGQIEAWDVLNEPRTNHDVMDNLSEGDLVMADWFNQALAVDPNSARYINDFGILTSGGGTNTSNQQDYADRVQFLLDNNAPVDGIGFQSHFVEGDLTGPEQIWTILDRFEQLGLAMQITEFDFATTDQQLQADFTRDFITAVFAHEGIDDFNFWGFWEDAHWRPDAALFNSDWSIKPNGQAFMDLVFDNWWTDEDVLTAGNGIADLRGFKGEYEFTISRNGEQQVVTAQLTDGGLVLDVTLQLLSGDIDGDGDIDSADLDALAAAAGTGNMTFDLDGDGVVSFVASGAGVSSDSDYLIRTLLGTEYGDANLDGLVDIVDFDLLGQGFQGLGTGWLYGDFSGSGGMIDIVDFDLLGQFFGFSSKTAASSIPEPSTVCLLCLALVISSRSEHSGSGTSRLAVEHAKDNRSKSQSGR